METEKELIKRIPSKITKSISKVYFSYGGSIEKLSDSELILLSNLINPYYSIGESEKEAIHVIQEWEVVQEISEISHKIFGELNSLIESSANKWADFMNRWRSDWERTIEREQIDRYERERYHKERYHKEMHPEMLEKELMYLFKSGDYHALLKTIFKIIDSYHSDYSNRIIMSIPNITPPTVNVPPEIIKETKEYSSKIHNELLEFKKTLPKARQILADYINKIIKQEEIFYSKD